MNEPSPRSRATLPILGALYFAQGLPFGFFALAVPVLLRRSGVSLALTGLSALLAIPWALKFLWAPFVDAHPSRGTVRRRAWIISMQLLVAATLTAIALSDVSRTQLTPLLVGFAIVSFLSATQDTATDALCLDLVDPADRGTANALQVGAYRLGMIAGGGGVLYFFDELGFSRGFLLMAAASVAFAAIASLAKEAPLEIATRTRHAGWNSSFVGFFRRADGAKILGLLVLLKGGDALGASMMKPFFVDEGFSDKEIAFIRGSLGGVSALVGALVAAPLLRRVWRARVFIACCALQSLAIAAFVPLALLHPGRDAYIAATVFEHFAGTLATAATFVTMMDRCRPAHRAADYAMQSSLFVMTTGLGLGLGGFIAGGLGYPAHYAIAAVLGVFAPFAALLLVGLRPPSDEWNDGDTHSREMTPRQ